MEDAKMLNTYKEKITEAISGKKLPQLQIGDLIAKIPIIQ